MGPTLETVSATKDIGRLEVEELERALLEFDSSLSALQRETALALAEEFLQALSAEREEGQTKKDYEEIH